MKLNTSLSAVLVLTVSYLLFTARIPLLAQNSTGINTPNPSSKAALDVETSNGFKQGLLVPRLAATDTTTLKTGIPTHSKGLVFYDTVNAVYRYYNGTRWLSFGGASGGTYWQPSATGIYYNDGNVGIGIATTLFKLHVEGNARIGAGTANNIAITIPGPNSPTGLTSAQDISYSFFVAGSARIRAYRGTSWDTYLQFMTNAGSTAADNPQVRMHISENGNIGIGTVTPSQRLHMVGNILLNDGKFLTNRANAAAITDGGIDFMIDGITQSGIYTAGSSNMALYTSGIERVRISDSGNMGIGTTAPATKLHIVSSTSPAFTLQDGTQGANKVLTSDASGRASWQSLGASSSPWTQSGTSVYLTASTNNVGIGTASPTERLTIQNDNYGMSQVNSTGTVNMSTYIGNIYTTDAIPGASIGTQTDHPFFIYVNNNGEKFYIGNSTQNYYVGIGTNNPLARLSVLSGTNWDIANTEGDFMIGDANYRLKMGVANGGGGAGDAYIGAEGGTNRIFIGAGTTIAQMQTMTIRPNKVGINTTALGPEGVFHIVGSEWTTANSQQVIIEGNGTVGPTLRFQTASRQYDIIGSTLASSSPGIGSFGIWDNTSSAYRLVISPTGNMGVDTYTPTAKLEVNGFTKLGSDAPAIKTKKFTGVTAATQGGQILIPHGLDATKILSMTGMVEYSTGYYVTNDYYVNAGYGFGLFCGPTDLYIYNYNNDATRGTSSVSILSRPFKVIVVYEE